MNLDQLSRELFKSPRFLTREELQEVASKASYRQCFDIFMSAKNGALLQERLRQLTP